MAEPTSSSPRIDAVIVTYNNRDTIRACVEPLLECPGMTVTVVDNDSRDDSLDDLAGLPVRTIRSGRNVGFGAGCNLGAAGGSAPLVLLLNPDARLVGDAVERMQQALETNPDVVLVGPRQLDESGVLVHSMRRFQRTSSLWAQALYLHRVVPRTRWANEIDHDTERYEHAAYPEWVSGACMLARRDALESIGGFDDGFFLYCEDQDLCARLVAAGGLIRYEPTATVVHIGGHSAPTASLLAVLAVSRIRFARKHSGRLAAAAQRAAVVAEALSHAIVSLAGRPASARGHTAALAASLRHPAAFLPSRGRLQGSEALD